MKKASIVFAVLLLVSILGTVIASIFTANEFMDGGISSIHNIVKSADSAIQSLKDTDWRNEVAQNKQLIHQESHELNSGAATKFQINAPVAAVFVKPATDGKARVDLALYSNDTATISKEDFHLKLTPGSTYQINLSYTGPDVHWNEDISSLADLQKTEQITAVLTVSLPSNEGVSMASDLDVGLFSIEGMKLLKLDTNLGAGVSSVKDCTIGTADIKTKTGLISVQGNVIKTSMNVDLSTGLCSVGLKRDLGCHLEYSIDVGKATCALNTVKGSTSNSHKEFMVSGITRRNYLEGGYPVTIHVNTGKLDVTAV